MEYMTKVGAGVMVPKRDLTSIIHMAPSTVERISKDAIRMGLVEQCYRGSESCIRMLEKIGSESIETRRRRMLGEAADALAQALAKIQAIEELTGE
jgi:hypothetical protein